MTRRHNPKTPSHEQVQDRLKALFLKALDAAEAAVDGKDCLEAMRQARVVITLHKAFTLAMPAPAQAREDQEDEEYKRGYKGRPTTLEGMHTLLEEKLSRLIEQRRAERMAEEQQNMPSIRSP